MERSPSGHDFEDTASFRSVHPPVLGEPSDGVFGPVSATTLILAEYVSLLMSHAAPYPSYGAIAPHSPGHASGASASPRRSPQAAGFPSLLDPPSSAQQHSPVRAYLVAAQTGICVLMSALY